MISLFIYLLGAVAIPFLILRLLRANKQKSNPFIYYFLIAIVLYELSEVVGVVFVGWSLITGSSLVLYWLDVITRLIYFFASLAIVQIPLYLYYPKGKKRFWFSGALLLIGIILFAYNLSIKYQSHIDPSGFIYWNVPIRISILTDTFFLASWFLASFLFLKQFVESKYKSVKTLLMGLGFSLGGIGVNFQDFAKTNLEFTLLYLAMIVGGILAFFGLMSKED